MAELKKQIVEYLSVLEGYHKVLKGLHWSATHHSLHVLTDEIDGGVLKVEDEIAEVLMGITDDKIGVGELNTLLPKAKTIESLLKEMKDDLIYIKKQVGDDAKVCGLQNILDDFMSDINKWNYLRTLA